MKKILLAILMLVSLSSIAQLQKNKIGNYRIDNLYASLGLQLDSNSYKPVVVGPDNKFYKSYWFGGGSSFSLAAIGTSPNGNGATYSGGVFNLQPANGSFGGVVSATTQSFAGNKTFNNNANILGQFRVNLGFIIMDEIATISTPAAGLGHIYAKTDGSVWYKNSAGVDRDLTATGAGEANTASSLGAELSGYAGKSGVDLQFKSFENDHFQEVNTNVIQLSETVVGQISNGQTAFNWGYPTGRLVNIRYLTTGTTYTPSAGTQNIRVVLVGGGGGGGGASGAASSVGAAAGGGAGAIVEKYITGVSDATAYTIAIGGAGAAGANSGGNGGTGGNTTLTVGVTTYTAAGGTGGTGQTSGTALAVTVGGVSGAGTNGDINGGGQNGDNGIRLSGTVGISGAGGTSFYGRGGAALSAAGAGNAAAGYGAGGGGALSTANTNRLGGAGTQGVIIVFEYL